MNRSFLAWPLLLILCAAPLATAQDQPEGDRPRQERRRGMGGDQTDRILEVLRVELDLDSGQEVRIRKVLDDAMKEVFARMGEIFGGGMDEAGRQKAREMFEQLRVDLAKKISAELSPAQRREFEVLVDQFDRRAQRFEDGRRAQERPAELFNPSPPSKRILMAKAERSLFLGPDELRAVMPYVERVIDAREALYEGRRVRRADLYNAADGGASEEELAERMAEIRAAEQFQHLELIASQQALRELLTVDQEARFVAMGLLE